MTMIERYQVKKGAPPVGTTPAIGLINPKYAHNVGAVLRAAACFGVGQVWFTGERVAIEVEQKGRLPREERMKGYADVELRQYDYFFDAFPPGTVPVAVELRENAESMPQFEHPENALYVFGPEDGGITRETLRHCHRVVVIPTRHCVNLSAAVYLTLYDRLVKRQAAGLEPVLPTNQILDEPRGFLDGDLIGVETR